MATEAQAAPRYNAKLPSVKRLLQEARELELEPNEQFRAAPLEDNLFEWHFTVAGPGGTPFEGGRYHGRLLMPSEYPLKPPAVMILTPNGRFEVRKRICLSVSDFHPESWQPAWGVRSILTALVAFFPTPSDGAIGALDYTEAERERLAACSLQWECATCGACMRTALQVRAAACPAAQAPAAACAPVTLCPPAAAAPAAADALTTIAQPAGGGDDGGVLAPAADVSAAPPAAADTSRAEPALAGAMRAREPAARRRAVPAGAARAAQHHSGAADRILGQLAWALAVLIGALVLNKIWPRAS